MHERHHLQTPCLERRTGSVAWICVCRGGRGGGRPQLSHPLYVISILSILKSSSGFSLYVRAFSILWITSSPWTARPNIVCLLSSHGSASLSAMILKRGWRGTGRKGIERKRGKKRKKNKKQGGQRTVFSVVIKNWLPLVFGPALAMLTV